MLDSQTCHQTCCNDWLLAISGLHGKLQRPLFNRVSELNPQHPHSTTHSWFKIIGLCKIPPKNYQSSKMLPGYRNNSASMMDYTLEMVFYHSHCSHFGVNCEDKMSPKTQGGYVHPSAFPSRTLLSIKTECHSIKLVFSEYWYL